MSASGPAPEGGRFVVSCLDPFGRLVAATRRRWEEHVRFEHPEIATRLDAVRSTIERPHLVRLDAGRMGRENYYRLGVLPEPHAHLYLKVCVEFGAGDALGRESVGLLVTADPLRKPKQGEQPKWP